VTVHPDGLNGPYGGFSNHHHPCPYSLFLEKTMSGTRPENPDAEARAVAFPETVPDPVENELDPIDEGNDADGFEPGTEMVPEKGDFHTPKQ
jgi:hypothetical protein